MAGGGPGGGEGGRRPGCAEGGGGGERGRAGLRRCLRSCATVGCLCPAVLSQAASNTLRLPSTWAEDRKGSHPLLSFYFQLSGQCQRDTVPPSH